MKVGDYVRLISLPITHRAYSRSAEIQIGRIYRIESLTPGGLVMVSYEGKLLLACISKGRFEAVDTQCPLLTEAELKRINELNS